MLIDIFASVTAQSIKKLVIVNAHGANRAAIDVAAHDHYHALGDQAVRVDTHNWWDLGAVPAMRQGLFGISEGLHATPSEISITQAISRQALGEHEIVHRPLSATTIARLGGDRHGPAVEHQAAYPDGLVGSNPSLANPVAGQELFLAAVKGLTEVLQAGCPQAE